MGFNQGAIKQLRQEENLTVEAFANKIGVSKQVASSWETGACEPRINSLTKIAEAFNKPIEYFFFNSGGTVVAEPNKVHGN